MTDLSRNKCEACRADAPRISDEEYKTLSVQIPDWSVKIRDNVKQLERSFEFPDFKQALAFTNRVGELAESEGHHPRLVTEWGKVVVTWWSHKIKGLHRNDLIMAAKTDMLVR